MAEPLPFLIAGGGIGGLAAAIALAQRGVTVEVLERGAAFAAAGAGIQLGPNAVKVLRALGVADAVAAHACEPTALAVFGAGSGRNLTRMPLGAQIAARCGAPYWTVHRADLHRALAAAARADPSITVRLDSTVTSLQSALSDRVAVTLADGQKLEGSALIGSDGVWSNVRNAVAPQYSHVASGWCAYRAIVPIDDAAGLDTTIVGAWLSPDAHIIHYPIRAGRALNLVVVTRDAWSGQEWSATADPRRIAAATKSFSSTLRDVIMRAREWHQWSLPQPVMLGQWHRGRIALLGDAAHAMLPFFAQGGAMALEDAMALAAAVAAKRDDLPAAFAAYHAHRRQRVARVQAASVRNGRIFHLSGPMALARDAAMKVTPGNMLMSRFDWLYGATPVGSGR